jgi:predicted metal-dependent peptidase
VRSSTLPTYNNKFLTFIFMNQIKETSIDDLLDGAKMAILNSLPFFGGVIISLKWQEMRGLDTLATDGETIFFDPIAVARFASENALAGVIIHEVGHCILGHCERIDLKLLNEDHKLIANQAADYCTNWLIDQFAQEWRDSHGGKESPIFKLPSGALRSEEHGPRSFEEIYHLLLSKWKKAGKPKPQPSPSGQLMPSPEGKPQGSGEGEQETQENGKGKASGATNSNITPESERAQLMAEKLAKVESRLSQILTTKENGDWAGDSISSAAMKKTLNYKDICWKRKMLLFCKAYNGRANYSMSRPNRRYIGSNVFLPTLRSKSMRELTIVIDTSGSISPPLFQQFLFQAHSICCQIKPQKIRLIQCDAGIHEDKIIKLQDLREVKLKGGGGTDFRPVFRAVQSSDCMLFFTDLFGDFPRKAPSYPVLWLDWDSGYSGKVPFGEHILLK